LPLRHATAAHLTSSTSHILQAVPGTPPSGAPTADAHLGAIRSEIRELDRYLPPLTGGKIVNLSLNEHCESPSPAVMEVFRDLDPMRLVTYDTELTLELRCRLAAREGVAFENIVLCPGSSAGIQLLLASLSGGPIVAPSICWNYYLNLSRLAALPVTTYAVEDQGDEFVVSQSSVVDAIRSASPTLTVFINPHMPTGALTDSAFLIDCAEQAKNGLVLVDEAYHGFSPAAETVASKVLTHPNLMVSKTFSKYFGLAGIRLGYLVASVPVAEHLAKAASPFSVPYLSARIALAALDSEAYWVDHAAEIMKVKDAFARRIAAVPNVRPYGSHGNFLLVAFASNPVALRAAAEIAAAGVAVKSASAYGLPTCLRIGIGKADAMDRVAAALEASVLS
jgi:histidinol-phosphate aminotransferase